MTFNQFIKLFLDIANAHNNIAGFGNGPIHEYLDSDTSGLGQYLWVDVEDSNLTVGVLKDRFTLYVMDAVDKDISNRNEVLSDTKRTIEDIISVLNNPYYYDFFEIEKSTTFKEFYDEKFNDEFCGWYCTVSLNTDFDYDSCEANVTGLPTVSSSQTFIWAGIDEGNSTTVYVDGITEE